ncbi:MYND-type domain-containing protein [Mycena kentingensis (nom. inval.)]|nr:MYND-type domain-containing protein [Mycena kentingensis (nom. inval.)]
MSMDANRLTSDHFAVMLGFEPQNPVDSSQIRLPIRFVTGQEIERNGRVSAFASDVTEAQQDRVWSQFCAHYLPATIAKFLELPPSTEQLHPSERSLLAEYPVNNAYLEILYQIQHLPYLYKYLRSSKDIAQPGKRLPQILAERIAERVVRWDAALKNSRDLDMQDFYLSAAGCSLQLLNTLCVQLIRTPDRATIIDAQTQQVLLPVLTQWAARYRGRELLGDVSARMVAWLSGSSQFNRAANRVRRATKNWDTCGLPACSKKEELKACVRCQTVRYCSVEHQKQDWNGATGSRHKLCCFQTEY